MSDTSKPAIDISELERVAKTYNKPIVLELIASLKIAVEELEQHAKDTETHDGCQASKKALAEIRKRVTL